MTSSCHLPFLCPFLHCSLGPSQHPGFLGSVSRAAPAELRAEELGLHCFWGDLGSLASLSSWLSDQALPLSLV